MAADEQFTRAKCVATGAIASLPKEAVELGHIPGWEAVDGPLPETHKPNAFPPKPVAEPGEGSGESEEESAGGGEEQADVPPAVARSGTKESAGSKPSAKPKE